MDFRHWGVSLSRRAKALKLWFLLRMYGTVKLQEYIRRVRFFVVVILWQLSAMRLASSSYRKAQVSSVDGL